MVFYPALHKALTLAVILNQYSVMKRNFIITILTLTFFSLDEMTDYKNQIKPGRDILLSGISTYDGILYNQRQ